MEKIEYEKPALITIQLHHQQQLMYVSGDPIGAIPNSAPYEPTDNPFSF